MIVVFCDLGGSKLLGKARELADTTGQKVAVLCSERSEEKKQNLIYLGADEVISCTIEKLSDWIPIITEIVESESNVEVVFFPSNSSANILMGLLHSNIKAKISFFLDGAVAVDADIVSKQFENSSVVLQRRFIADKTALVSLKLTSFAEPFAESSRYGKIRSVRRINSGLSTISLPATPNSSNKLTVLVGRGTSEKTAATAKRLAEKYHGEMRMNSGKVEVIYGPCIAVDLSTKLRELPEFKGELISIAEKNLPIGSIAEVAVVTPELDSVLEGLASD
jgi:hypothetical protein